MSSIETQLYISTKEVQNALSITNELGRMLSGPAKKRKGRLAETWHLTPGA